MITPGGVGGIVVSAHDYGSQGHGFEPAIRRVFYYSYNQPTLVRGSSITSTDMRRKTRMSERLRNRRRRQPRHIRAIGFSAAMWKARGNYHIIIDREQQQTEIVAELPV